MKYIAGSTFTVSIIDNAVAVDLKDLNGNFMESDK